MRFLVLCVAGLLLTSCGADAGFVPPGCDDELAAVLNELEHYAELGPVDFVGGGPECAGTLITMDVPPEVVAHYTTQLEEHGWTVTAEEDQDLGTGAVVGRKDGFEYEVSWEQGDGVEWETSAVVIVRRA